MLGDECPQQFAGQIRDRLRRISMLADLRRSRVRSCRVVGVEIERCRVEEGGCNVTNHIDAIYWTGLDAKIAACAFGSNYRVHQFGAAEDRIYRAGLNTLGASDAFIFSNYGNAKVPKLSMGGIEPSHGFIEQFG